MKNSYANIVVNAPVFREYTYRIPEIYKDAITIGSKVTVGFKNREVTGFVVSFPETVTGSLQKKLRPIIHVFTPNPAIPLTLLKFARWIANYYVAPLGEVISCALPKQLEKKKVVTYSLDKKKRSLYTKQLTPKQQLVIDCLQKGAMSLAMLKQEVPSPYSTVSSLVKKELVTVFCETKERIPSGLTPDSKPLITVGDYTPEQQNAYDHIVNLIKSKIFKPVLLHGITGSGKTEIYIHCIDFVLKTGREAIMLVPEIALTPQLIDRFKRYFKNDVAILHSGLSLGERYDEWERIKEKRAKIAIGTRSALFAPFDNLGIIIVDEEHDTSYKQNNMPFYHGRDCAVMRAKVSNAVIVLGSATPSLESYYNTVIGKYSYLHLSKRVGKSALPDVSFVNIATLVKDKKQIPIISPQLSLAIQERIEKNEQTILFLNRRGNAPFIQCLECGHVYTCKFCSVSMTFHSTTKNLLCHYCDYSITLTDICPSCKGHKQIPLGAGTQKVEEVVQKQFPSARILRMDKDTIAGKEFYNNAINKLKSKEIDILIGTQVVSKGHDFENVTLVGVIYADTSLNIPDFRAAERTFNLLTQVSGRSGRRDKKGSVIIQTMNPSHYAMTCAKEHNFTDFYNFEIQFRETFNYPPYSRIIFIKIESRNEQDGDAFIHKVKTVIQNDFSETENIDIMGPAKAVIYKIKNRYRWNIMLKSLNIIHLKQFLPLFINTIEKKGKKKTTVKLSIDVDPVSFL